MMRLNEVWQTDPAAGEWWGVTCDCVRLCGGRKGSKGWRASSCAIPVIECRNGRDTWHVAVWLTRADVPPLGVTSYCNLIIWTLIICHPSLISSVCITSAQTLARRNSEELWQCCPNVSWSQWLRPPDTHLSCSYQPNPLLSAPPLTWPGHMVSIFTGLSPRPFIHSSSCLLFTNLWLSFSVYWS